MECDRYEVLHKVVRIVSCTAFETPRSFKAILRFLTKAFHLEDAAFLLLESRQKIFSKVITASGSDFFLPCRQPLGKTPEGDALRSGRPVFLRDRFLFPVFNSRRRFGLLSLTTLPSNPLSADLSDLLRTVCDQLAGLAQNALIAADERRQVAELKLLSALGRELTYARTASDLLQAAGQEILRHSGAACVILRPLYGGTVLGRDYLLTRPGYRGLRSLFLDREEKQSTRAVTEGRPVFLNDLSGEEELAEPLPPAMVTVPLLFQGRVLGTLTLFGGQDEEGIPLISDSGGRRFFIDVGSQIANALERVTALEQLGTLSAENDRKLRETTLLYRISRMMHSTLRLNELMHLILSAATVPEGGGFERAMLFMINERSGVLQGMLGVTRETAALVLPLREDPRAWDRPVVTAEVQEAQHQALFCRQVMKQRLLLDEKDNALGRAARQGRVVFVPELSNEPPSGVALAEELRLGPYACAPLMGRERPLGVLVVANPVTEEITSALLRFLELFANQAGGGDGELHAAASPGDGPPRPSRDPGAADPGGEDGGTRRDGRLGRPRTEKPPGLDRRVCPPPVPCRPAGEPRAGVRRASSPGKSVAWRRCFPTSWPSPKNTCSALPSAVFPKLSRRPLHLEAEALDPASIELAKELAGDLPTVQGDEQKLRQVLINLISNARQAMKYGGVLTIRAYRSTLRGDEAVAVEVEDTGGGIPADVLRNIFNPFFTTKGKGTGLGLSISHRIVEHHHGEIEVQNRENGVVFTLRLPIRGGAATFPLTNLRTLGKVASIFTGL